ncbi:MAG: metal ABC transporter substrate-binding protein [Candidatus Fimadaptatus sp.]|jgi:zinc transport system substrate-binding protein
MAKGGLRALMLSAALLLAGAPARAADEFDILTSFYPMYLLTVNVAGGIEGVNVVNMAEQNVGCLHDYSLRTGDMRMIHSADVVVVNGAGMEGFIDKIVDDQQKPVIDASQGIELITAQGHGDEDDHAEEAEDAHVEGDAAGLDVHAGDDASAEDAAHVGDDAADDAAHAGDDTSADDSAHAGDDASADATAHAAEPADAHAGHDHGAVNAHIWMSPRQAMAQVENIARGLIEQDGAHAQQYRANADAYIARLKALDEQIAAELAPVRGARIVTSHPAFEYLARDYGIEIVASLGQEPGRMPRTRDMAELVDTVRGMNIRALFVERAYAEKAAEVLARETGVSIYTLDSLTSGDLDAEAYERAILNDARTLREALEDA